MKNFIKYSTGKRATYVLLCLMVVGLFSCKREVPERELLSNYEANNYAEVFKVFWNGMNSNYMFWDKETIDWDSVYRAYKPKFDSLDEQAFSDTTQNRCFQYLADMTKGLK